MKSKKKKITVIVVAIVVIVALCFIPLIVNQFSKKGDTIVVATESYSEEYTFGYLFKDLIEEYTNYKVDLKEGLGGTDVCFQALKSGQTDVYLEYTGTAYGAILGHNYDSSAGVDVYKAVKDEMEKNYGLTPLDTIGFNNTYCLAISKDISEKYGITKISDLVSCPAKFRFSPTFEYIERSDGIKQLQMDYKGLEFSKVIPLEDTLKYTSLESGETDIVLAFSTDGLLKKYDLVILEDDLHSMYPYEAFPFVRQDALDSHPGLKEALNKLSGAINDDEMAYLNYLVDVKEQKPEKVAHDYLLEKGFISK